MTCLCCGSNNLDTKKVIKGNARTHVVYRHHCNDCGTEFSSQSKQMESFFDKKDEEAKKASKIKPKDEWS